MQRWRYLKPLDSMERITQQDLCNKLDYYFARIDAEDIGFVILDDAGNDQFVLCPAAWMAIMNILNLFHNDELNTTHAQLVFVTHNPVYLNSNLLRRDEIKFVERNSDDHTSTMFSLSDFGTGFDEDEDYLKRYLANMYGAIPDPDFSSVFENPNTSAGSV